jgi:hypothetical protein
MLLIGDELEAEQSSPDCQVDILVGSIHVLPAGNGERLSRFCGKLLVRRM